MKKDETKCIGQNSVDQNAQGFIASLLEMLPMMVFVKDAKDLRFVRFNKAGEDLLGFSRDELIGKNDFDFFPPEQAAHFTAHDRAVIAGQKLVDIPEEQIMTRDKGIRYLHTKKIPLFDAAGNASFLLGISEDITDQREVRKLKEQLLIDQASLENSERQFRTIAETIPPIVWKTDPVGNLTYANSRWLQYFGKIPKGQDWQTTVHPDDLPRVLERFSSCLKTGETYEIQYRRRRADGEYRWFLGRANPLINQRGEVIEWIGTLTDIHDQRESLERIQRLQQVTSALQRGTSAKDVAEILLAQGLEALGAQAGLVVQKQKESSQLELLASRNYPESFVAFWNTCTTDSALPIPFVLKTGMAIFLESRDEMIARFPEVNNVAEQAGFNAFIGLPLSVQDRVVGALGLAFAARQKFTPDLTSFISSLASQCAVALERALLFDAERKNTEALKKAVQTRDEFLSIASHELKTPMTSLKLQMQMASRRLRAGTGETLPPERLRNLFEISNRQIDRLTSLVEDLLDVSKIQAGRLDYHFEKLSLLGIVNEVCEKFSDPSSADNRSRIKISSKIDQGIEGHWDRSRMEQVFVNLVSNSVKYAPGSPITIEAHTDGEIVRIEVGDLGPGIPTDRHSMIFERFERFEVSQHVSGLGLGLYIVRQIITGHSGKISVLSEPGKGTKFVIQLPLDPVASHPKPTVKATKSGAKSDAKSDAEPDANSEGATGIVPPASGTQSKYDAGTQPSI